MKSRACLLAIVSLGFFASLGGPACADDSQISGPSFTTAIDDGRIHIKPALQLPVISSPPFACDAGTRGSLVLGKAAQLCVCDEKWKLVNTNRLCEWSDAK